MKERGLETLKSIEKLRGVNLTKGAWHNKIIRTIGFNHSNQTSCSFFFIDSPILYYYYSSTTKRRHERDNRPQEI